MLLEFSFFFVHLFGISPVEVVNCPPVRAKPKIIRRNAIRRRDFSFIWLSPGSSCLRSRERRSSVDHPSDYYFSLAEDALERPLT
jgi:hypothetical protein